MSLTTTQMIEQKLRPIIRQKPRDFYDVYFILRANLLAVGQRVILKQVLIKLRETKIDFKAELKLFLPKDHWGMIKDFKVALERKLRDIFSDGGDILKVREKLNLLSGK